MNSGHNKNTVTNTINDHDETTTTTATNNNNNNNNKKKKKKEDDNNNNDDNEHSVDTENGKTVSPTLATAINTVVPAVMRAIIPIAATKQQLHHSKHVNDCNATNRNDSARTNTAGPSPLAGLPIRGPDRPAGLRAPS